MKKLLAIVLTLTMILSCGIVNAFAAREVIKTVTENKIWQWDADNCYTYIEGISGNDKAARWEFDVKLDPATATGSYFGADPMFNMENGTIGVGSTSLSYAFEAGVWYHVVLDGTVASGSDIYVDGALIGNVATQIHDKWCGNPGLIAIDNLKITGDGIDYFEDFEDGTFASYDGNGNAIDDNTATYENLNKWTVVTNGYMAYDDEATYGDSGEAYFVTIDLTGEDEDSVKDGRYFKFDVRLATADANMNIWAYSGLCIDKNGIGVSGNKVSYTFTPGEWYTIEAENTAAGCAFSVNGAAIGTSSNKLSNAWYGPAFYGVHFDNFEVYESKGGDLIKAWDCETPANCPFWANGGSENFFKTEGDNYSADLGLKHWQWDPDNCYTYIEGISGEDKAAKWEFDVKLDPATATGSYFGADPMFNTKDGTIGVGSTSVNYNFVPEVWYHVVLDGTVASGTDVYVNGVLIGNVATQIHDKWCGNPGYIAIDNLKITGDGIDYFEDFEDGTFASYDGNGNAIDYVLEEEEDSIFNHFETTEPGGTAYLVKSGYDYEYGQDTTEVGTYYDLSNVNPGTHEYIINFDLALIPEIDTTNDTYFEIWTNTASRRWQVGTTFTGRQDDGEKEYTAFDWGEATIDNFHNITYAFIGRTGYIYVDKNLVYEGLSGTTWDNLMIGYVWNGSAIIDNFQLFTTDYAPIENGFTSDEDVTAINLDAEDFCAANGHIQYSTEITVAPKCEATGTAITTCAVCGETAKETVIPVTGHSWPSYYSDRKVSGNKITWECRNGCGKTVEVDLSECRATETPYFFLDFADKIVVQEVAGVFKGEGQTVKGGIGTFEVGCGQNYNQIDDLRNGNDYTVAFDFCVDELFDNSDTESYGHKVYFWFGGNNGMYNQAGYDFDNQCFFVEASVGAPYDKIEVPFAADFGKWHSFMFKVCAPGEDYDDNWCKIFIDGEEVLSFDEWWDTAFALPTEKDFTIIRDFGVAAKIDNFMIGSSDLDLEILLGDVNGDHAVNSKDLRLLKLYIAGLADDNDIVWANSNLNGDDEVSSKDSLALKALFVK